MTQPDQGQTVALPPAKNPQTSLVWSDNPFGKDNNETVPWQLGKQHPFIAELNIVRMFVIQGVGVEVYSWVAEGNSNIGVRYLIPWEHVKLIQEVMDPQTFIEEIALAESGENEQEEEEPEEEEKPEPAVAATPLHTYPGLVPMPPPNGAS